MDDRAEPAATGVLAGSPAVPSLDAHLQRWLGAWPPRASGVQIVRNEALAAPGWDGQRRLPLGVVDADGNGVFGVAPDLAAELEAQGLPPGTALPLDELRERVPAAVGGWLFAGVFRWSADPTDASVLPDAGVWVPAEDERVPAWLKPFGGDVLVVFDGDDYVAGVGVKRHDELGHELSVGTEEAARGRGLARRLVAQAARELVGHGLVVTYLHAPDNIASARVAEAAGFPDRGWQVIGLAPQGTPPR